MSSKFPRNLRQNLQDIQSPRAFTQNFYHFTEILINLKLFIDWTNFKIFNNQIRILVRNM